MTGGEVKWCRCPRCARSNTSHRNSVIVEITYNMGSHAVVKNELAMSIALAWSTKIGWYVGYSAYTCIAGTIDLGHYPRHQ
jgi:hypothetical protein